MVMSLYGPFISSSSGIFVFMDYSSSSSSSSSSNSSSSSGLSSFLDSMCHLLFNFYWSIFFINICVNFLVFSRR